MFQARVHVFKNLCRISQRTFRGPGNWAFSLESAQHQLNLMPEREHLLCRWQSPKEQREAALGVAGLFLTG